MFKSPINLKGRIGVYKMKFPENLKKFREIAGYAMAKDFAKALGIPYSTYMGYEKRGIEPKYDMLCKIAAALHVSIDDLLGFKMSDLEKCISICQKARYKVKIDMSNDAHDAQNLIIHISPPIKFYDYDAKERKRIPQKRVFTLSCSDFIKLVNDSFSSPDYIHGLAWALLDAFEDHAAVINEREEMQKAALFNDEIRENHKDIYFKLLKNSPLSPDDWGTIREIKAKIANNMTHDLKRDTK